MAGTGLTRIGPYALLSRLGAGGMGTVYLALHRGIGGFEKRLAVKCLNAQVADDAQFIEMLIDEARLTAQLSHPNIVQVMDLASSDGLHYLVMEYVEGIDARTLAAQGPLDFDEIAVLVADAARGLAYAHRKTDAGGRPLHIVHRDISGHNLLVSTAGVTKVLDFGIAKAASNRQVTEMGVLKGKLAYMSPEQAMGKPLDHRSDLFSLGIVLWELCARRRLFAGDTEMDVLLKVQRCAVEPPGRFVDGIPPALEALVLQCLAGDPAERIADGDALADALTAVAATVGAVEPAARRLGRRVAAYLAAHPPAPIAPSALTPAEATLVAAATRVAEAPPPLPTVAHPRRYVRHMATGAAVLGLLGGGVWLARRGSMGTEKATPSSPEAPVAAAAPAQVRTVEEVQHGKPSVTTEHAPSPVTSPVVDSRPPAPSPSGGREHSAPPKHKVADAPQAKAASMPSAPPKPPDVRADVGYLSINALPWARVYIDGQSVAESTPLLRHALAPGRHVVVLVNPELRVRKELTFDIRAGEESRESIALP